jgi:regulator of RNase E activity RraA
MTGVAPLDPGYTMVGEAVTLRYLPYREDLNATQSVADPEHPQRKTIDNIQAGGILVIDARGDLRSGTLGEILMARLKARGATGMVTDGAVRDVTGIKEVGLPTYVGGVHASASQTIHYAVDANLPVQCGGVTVVPGDILVGDADGVIVIPRKYAAQVAEESLHHAELEVYLYERISSGQSLRGVYPPNEQMLREYEVWKQGR